MSGSWRAAPFENAMDSGGLVGLSLQGKAVDIQLLQDIPQHSQDSRTSRLIVCPLYISRLGTVRAFMILVLAPLRPYDESLKCFVRALVYQVSTSQLSAVVIKEDKAHRSGLSAELLDNAASKLLLELGTKALEVGEGKTNLPALRNSWLRILRESNLARSDATRPSRRSDCME